MAFSVKSKICPAPGFEQETHIKGFSLYLSKNQNTHSLTHSLIHSINHLIIFFKYKK